MDSLHLPTARRVISPLVVGLIAIPALSGCLAGPPDGPGSEQPTKARGYISRADFGQQWPLTVADGVLSCQNGAVTFASGGVVYGVNGTAKSRGFRGIDPIWQLAPPRTTSAVVERLSMEQRQAIFAARVGCEDRADKDAEKTCPNDIHAQTDYERNLASRCNAGVRKKYHVSEQEFSAIGNEGVAYSWPPLTPLRVSIGPLIQRGLALCRP
jgi:hypothetical protein